MVALVTLRVYCSLYLAHYMSAHFIKYIDVVVLFFAVFVFLREWGLRTRRIDQHDESTNTDSTSAGIKIKIVICFWVPSWSPQFCLLYKKNVIISKENVPYRNMTVYNKMWFLFLSVHKMLQLIVTQTTVTVIVRLLPLPDCSITHAHNFM